MGGLAFVVVTGELVLPGARLVLEHGEEGRLLHRLQGRQVVVELREELVPSADQLHAPPLERRQVQRLPSWGVRGKQMVQSNVRGQ